MGLSIALLTPILSTNFLAIAKAMQSVSNLIKCKRDPLFEFELDESLFKFEANKPSLEPLFQLPLRLRTRLDCYRLIWGKSPPNPLRGGIKQARPIARARARRATVQNRGEQTTSRARVPTATPSEDTPF